MSSFINTQKGRFEALFTVMPKGLSRKAIYMKEE